MLQKVTDVFLLLFTGRAQEGLTTLDTNDILGGSILYKGRVVLVMTGSSTRLDNNLPL